MLRELAIQNGYTDEKLLEVLPLISDSNTMQLVADCLLDGHLCEMTAMCRVKAMEPVALFDDGLYHARTNFPMVEYMEKKGISPQNAYNLVVSAYENACKKAASIGISAPKLPAKTNQWDCYYVVAMMFADYWMTVGDDTEKAAMMAYEYLSDPDGTGLLF